MEIKLVHNNNYTADLSGGYTSAYSNIAPLEFVEVLKVGEK